MVELYTYTTRFYDYLQELNLSVEELPINIQKLISVFEDAKSSWDVADMETKEKLLTALIQSDVFISAQIIKIIPTKETATPTDPTKIKLLALKAKAILLKQQLNRDRNK